MRFSIRDVLWLTALAAVLVAWWIDRRAAKLAAERSAAQIAALQKEMKARTQFVRVITLPANLASKRQPDPDTWDYQVPPHFERLQRIRSHRP